MTRLGPLLLLALGTGLVACPAAPQEPPVETSDFSIIRGDDVPEGTYPWMIYANGCTASLISPSWVLMAAHCFGGQRNANGTLEGVEITSYPVLFGHPDRTSPEATRHDVANVHLHPEYLPLTEEETWGLEPYDVALLELEEPILLPEYIRLPTRDPIAGEGLVAAGWGMTEAGTTATVLQEAVLIVSYDADCYVVDEIRFCTEGNKQGSNIGGGDSGGPVFTDDGNGFMVLGTNSTSNGDSSNPVAMHAQTRWFVPWILEVAGDEFACTGEGEDEVCEADVDECALELDTCGDRGACENTVEAYTCACDEGYVFDGTTCVEESIDEPDEGAEGAGCGGAGPRSSGAVALLGLFGLPMLRGRER